MASGPAPDYGVFCGAHRGPYLAYTRARIGDEAAAPVVEAVLRDLRSSWSVVLSSACPAREAWAVLGHAVDDASHSRSERRAGGDVLHGLLARPQADAALLHYRLGLTLTAVAQLTGVSPSEVAVRVLTAERHLGSEWVQALTERR